MKELAQAPEISVVIPHLNQPAELRRCLQSLHRQNIPIERIEFIVVDNGSTSPPTAICGEFPRVRLEVESTPGPGPARNRGISVSAAPLLAFIDADCIAHEGWLADVQAAFRSPRTQIVGGDVRIALKDPSRPTMLESYESIFAYRQREYIERQGFSGTGNLAMLRSAYHAIGPFAGIRVAEDRDWGQRATRLGYKIEYRPGMVVYHAARSRFEDLFAKWDRHIAHDLVERRTGMVGRLTWTLRSLAIAGSPVLELKRIATTKRVSGWRDRYLALLGLARIRQYRSRRMRELAKQRQRPALSQSWNRM